MDHSAFVSFLSNTVKRYEEEEYRGKPAAATGGGWKPRARGRGKNTSEREPERMAPVGGTGCDRYIAPACPSRKKGPPSGGKLGGTAERSIRPNR